MFLGKHERNLDDKGRLAIPARFREQLPGGSVITIAPDSCLRVYPPGEWEVVTDQNRVSAATGSIERNLIRRMFSEAALLELDGQGRSLLPANLREQAGISTSAIVVGVNNVVEIWSLERWQTLEENTADFTRLADEVAGTRLDH
ncbi:MAG: division/cell wall cluster transcriptional repressor MraZ [Candidatus Dormibacteria bacterium]